MFLETIESYNDIKKLSKDELLTLSSEIREFLVKSIAQTGGHLASNLGAVELTVALHYLMDFPKDKLVFDVGHQAYVHKLLTGRGKRFESLRKTEGLSGFPNPDENETDLFRGGHASTAIGEGVGLCEARRIKGTDEKIAVVVGDGAMTGGLSFEAINNAANLKENLTIILNDNNMSITRNVGGVSENIASLRTSKAYTDLKEDVIELLERVPGVGEQVAVGIRHTKDRIKRAVLSNMYFEDMGIMYLGPVDGHDIEALLKMLGHAFSYKGPVIVHVITKKGKGYGPAERHPSKFHGTSVFDISTGKVKKKEVPDYTDVVSKTMKMLAKRDNSICVVTAAMANGSGASSYAKLYGDRFFDVGIAEEHAVVLAAALAKQGLRPIVCIYSTFLQRAFDQILMEVCLNKLPVVFAIDRAGIVGADGATHQGVFDLSYLSMMPNIQILAPKNARELGRMLFYATSCDEPVAIRYPRGEAYRGLSEFDTPILKGKWEEIKDGADCQVLAVGSMVKRAKEVEEALALEGIYCGITNARFIKPLDSDYLNKIKDKKLIVTIEENSLIGGFGMQAESALRQMGFNGKLIKFGVPDSFIPHGSNSDLEKQIGLDFDSICQGIREAL